MDKCPHCGSDDGLFSKEVAKYDQYYNFDGSPSGYSDLDRIVKRKGTPLYCVYCGKKVTTLEKLEEQK